MWHSCGDFSLVHTGISSDGTSKFHSFGSFVDREGISWTFRACIDLQAVVFSKFQLVVKAGAKPE